MPFFSLSSPTSGNATQLQSRVVSATAPATGAVLVWNGSAWVPGQGVTGATGPGGVDGQKILSGAGVPSTGIGRAGDFYLDTSTLNFYGPRTGNSWGSGTQLTTITGPTGVGATGPRGETGPASTVTGPTGPASLVTGPSGPPGSVGPTGAVGPPAGITIGAVTQGSVPSASLTGPAGLQVLSLVLARGATGPSGSPGATGPIAGLALGDVADGGSAGASIYPDGLGGYLLDLTLPRGPTGATGAASTVTGPQGQVGPTGPSVTGPTGAASTVPGPTGPAGESITGPTGAAGAVSTVPGPTGPAGQSITGPAGATGAASTVPGPTGPAGQSITGPSGPQGQTGPTGPAGAAGSGSGLSFVSVPSGPTGSGSVGQAAYDATYAYFAYDTNKWMRLVRAAWAPFVAIPTMTSNTAPSGEASASAVLSGTTQAYRAFNKSTFSGSNSDDDFYASAQSVNSWVQYDFGEGVKSAVASYSIASRNSWPYGVSGNSQSQAPTAWTFSGSNDGTNFTTLDTRTGQSFTQAQTRTFTLTTTVQYRIYRWTWTSLPTGDAVVVPMLRLNET